MSSCHPHVWPSQWLLFSYMIVTCRRTPLYCWHPIFMLRVWAVTFDDKINPLPPLVSKGTKKIPKATSWQGTCCWATVVTYIPCPVPNAIPFHWTVAQHIWLSRQLRLTPSSPKSAHGGSGSGHLYNIPIPQWKPGFCNHQLQELCLWLMLDLQAQEWKQSTTRVPALLPQPQTDLRTGGQVKGCIRCCGEGSSKLSPTEKDLLALV